MSAAESETPVLVLRGVTKRFESAAGPVTALRGVSLEAPRGSFCVITGPSGSGKTTLLQIATLLEPADEGEIWFDGERTDGLDDRARAARRAGKIGMIFQRFHLLPHRSALDNVRFRFRYAPRRREEEIALSRAALERVGLAQRARQRARLLSGGEMQRVAIARAIALPPLLLAADEPTGNLDRAAADAVLECLRDLNRRGVTVLLATHNEALARPGDRRVRLEDGRMRAGAP